MIDLDALDPGKAKALDSCWKAATREGFNLNDSAELGDFTTAYMAALASDEVRACREIAKAAKAYVDGTLAASGSLSELGPEEFFGYLCDADREAHDRLASLVRQHLLPPPPSQPEEQAR